MKTMETGLQLIDRIKALTEIELDDLLGEINDHLYQNKMQHLAERAFQIDDQIDTIEELEDEIKELKRERDDLKSTVDKIRNIV